MLGIAAASFLHALQQDVPAALEDFGLFAGDSTGAIISCALGHGLSPSEIKDLYLRKAEEMFPKRWQPWRGWIGCTRYKPDGMRRVFTEVFEDDMFTDLKRDVMIWAAMIAPHNGIRHWKSWRKAETKHQTPVVDALMASSAPWTYFPPLEIDGKVYFDGGHACNNGSLYAVAEAVRKGEDFDEVKVLNITLRSPERHSVKDALGVTSLVGGMDVMPSGVIEFNEQGIEYSADALLGGRYCKICMHASGSIDETNPAKLAMMAEEGRAAYDLNRSKIAAWFRM